MKTHEMLNMDYAQLEQLVAARFSGYTMKSANDNCMGEGHLIASAVLCGYHIKLTRFRYRDLRFVYQVDYGADSIQYVNFKTATEAFKWALDHAEEIAYDS